MDILPYNHSNINLAKILRSNMTPEERKLWYCFLRTYKPRFVRQKPIGDYIVDFFCKEKMLAVEIDGSQHYEARNMAEDMERTTKLKGYGISIIRFGNQDINQQFEAVCAAIDRYVPEKQLWI